MFWKYVVNKDMKFTTEHFLFNSLIYISNWIYQSSLDMAVVLVWDVCLKYTELRSLF